ncbi:hypothetical protein BpHYR1_015293 [Brachionus plicatilis]|uniref:Uncharacterized protein n=1 Tax=Brachionus plicatilis TaxID=10195 RepID=A0A3M7QR54_BRAPC|nr:hypothetical protein BpHYR1_015293 [Brachionus plicatilis]
MAKIVKYVESKNLRSYQEKILKFLHNLNYIKVIVHNTIEIFINFKLIFDHLIKINFNGQTFYI